MLGFTFDQGTQEILAVLIVAGMFFLFLREIFPVEVTAMCGAAAMVLLGILPQDQVLSVLANPAPWTIAAMFIIVGGLVRTGALDWVTQLALRHLVARPLMTLICLSLVILAMSAFMNNTPIVVVMIPVFIQLCRKLDLAPSKMLIPLSYLTIFGGTMTLIGTSTNILVDGIGQSKGMAPFGIFEMAPVGMVMAGVGTIYLALFARRLLPERTSMGMMLSNRSSMKFFTEVALSEESSLIGQPVLDVDIFKRDSLRVIDVLRGDASLRRALQDVVLQVGDRVVVRTPMAEVLSLQTNKDLHLFEQLASVQTETVEALITPGCRMVGRSLGAMRLRRRYGVYPLAVHRRSQNIGRQLDDLVVQVGDTLLLEGAAQDIQRLAADMEMGDISAPSQRAYRRGHAPIVMACLVAIVGLSALNVAPISILALLGVVLILITGCIDADEAFGFIDGRLLAMIFGMLAVGLGLEHSGAVSHFATLIAPKLAEMPPFLVILIVYAMTSFFTELVSNNAIAVMMTPVVIGLAQSVGIDPRPLVVAVMMGASASFATPIGYQTNTLVYGPGGYEFADFMRFGLPLNIIMALVMSVAIPFFFPFQI